MNLILKNSLKINKILYFLILGNMVFCTDFNRWLNHYYINNTEGKNGWYFGFDGCDFVDKSYLHIMNDDRNKMWTAIDNVAHGKVKLFYD